MKKMFFAIVGVMALLTAAAWAQQGPGPGMGRGMRGKGPMMYDPSKAETIQGQVAAVNEMGPANGRRKGIVLKLDSGGRTITVHVGPDFYVNEQQVKIAAGDNVEILGVKASPRGEEVFLAAEIKKGGDVLKLRDADGVPLWAGKGPRAEKPPRKAPVGC